MSATETRIEIILPERRRDLVSERLRELTERLCNVLDEDGAGGLGGDYGYGVNYENETFAMHRFCWCSGDDCPWCSWTPEKGAHFQEKNTAHGALPHAGDGLAPNFWHKRTGFRVWWYKWIGRDNEIENMDGYPFEDIFRDCIKSLPEPPKDQTHE